MSVGIKLWLKSPLCHFYLKRWEYVLHLSKLHSFCPLPLRRKFPGMDNGAIDKPLRYNPDRYDVVSAVQSTADEALLLAVVEVPDQLPGFLRAADSAFPYPEIALAQFKC